jgi:SOS-response transcriptional repressor LexA
MAFGQSVRMIDEQPKDRLSRARAAAGFASPTEAARAYPRQLNVNTLISHENGNRPLSRKAAAKYADLFDTAAGWLLYGEKADAQTGEVDVPLLSMISAGDLMRDDVADEALGHIKVSDLPVGDWIALRVVGDSMDRISPPESIILVNRRDKRLVPNRPYVIADEHGNATYKRYRPGPPMRFEPVSTNPKHEPIFPQQEPVIVGRVKRSMIDM